jgi:hypothetical protein
MEGQPATILSNDRQVCNRAKFITTETGWYTPTRASWNNPGGTNEYVQARLLLNDLFVRGYGRGGADWTKAALGGESASDLPSRGDWKCLFLAKISDIRLCDGPGTPATATPGARLRPSRWHRREPGEPLAPPSLASGSIS